MTTVAIVGLGYVGLPTALGMLEVGLRVIGFDVSETRLALIKSQDVDLIAADQDRLGRFLGRPEFTLTTKPRSLTAADLIVVCVPTPVDEHLVPDVTILRGACAAVVEQTRPGQTIVLTSTTYVGSTREMVVEPLAARGLVAGRDVYVVFSPERIDPGNAAHVPEHTPRVVGGVSAECTRRAVEVLGRTSARMHQVSSPEVAEMTKLLENTFRAVNIAFANEFAGLARELDVDPIEVISAAAMLCPIRYIALGKRTAHGFPDAMRAAPPSPSSDGPRYRASATSTKVGHPPPPRTSFPTTALCPYSQKPSIR